MNAFIRKHASVVTGHLTGLDRLVLRGQLAPISYVDGMRKCLSVESVLLKDFGDFAAAKTKALVMGAEKFAERRGRPVVYLDSPSVDKDEVVRTIAERDKIERGLVCVLKTVEPCVAFDVRRNRAERKLELVMRQRKCSTFYHYAIHPEWGFGYARIQSWLPFRVQVYLNGREWLARTLDRAGIRYERADNTFTWIEDLELAQAILDKQAGVAWSEFGEQIARCVNPLYPRVFDRCDLRYSWTAHQTEVATDVMFETPAALEQAYRGLIVKGISSFGCADVLRFLGHAARTNRDGSIRRNFSGDITSHFGERPEGRRLKHFVNGNSVKVYDKAQTVVRVEMTMTNPHDFKTERPKQGGSPNECSRRILRKSVEDLPRLMALAKDVNDRYLDALASLHGTTPLSVITATVVQPAMLSGRRVRALQPCSPDDSRLLRAVSRAEFVLNGFRNRDVCRLVHSESDDEALRRRQRANVTRRLRLLRAHGLIARLPRSNRYQLTDGGRVVVSAILAALDADMTRLTHAA